MSLRNNMKEGSLKKTSHILWKLTNLNIQLEHRNLPEQRTLEEESNPIRRPAVLVRK